MMSSVCDFDNLLHLVRLLTAAVNIGKQPFADPALHAPDPEDRVRPPAAFSELVEALDRLASTSAS